MLLDAGGVECLACARKSFIMVLFLELRKLEKLGKDDYVGVGWSVEELLRNLMKAFLVWLSNNQDFWATIEKVLLSYKLMVSSRSLSDISLSIEMPVSLSKSACMTEFSFCSDESRVFHLLPADILPSTYAFVLDMQFLVEITRFGEYFSNEILNESLVLISRMESIFFCAGLDPNRSEIQRIGFSLVNQIYKPPPGFGPYLFNAAPYVFLGTSKESSMSRGAIIGIAVGCSILVLALMALGIYAIQQKKRAEKAIGLSKSFASWAASSKDSGGAPQLKGARWFSYDELKRCTDNFSGSN